MCGIAGFQGSFDTALLEAMSTALAHRGPDGAGAQLFADAHGRTGLAHRRLSIIDLSEGGAQPLTVQCEACGAHGHADLSLVYNGELYNYRELRLWLEGRGHQVRSASDSEVLLHLYGELGPDMLARMNGIFAFAIRDGRPAAGDRVPGDVFLARDQLGVKPLYMAEGPEGVVFASEMKSVLACPTVPRTLDLLAVHETLALLWTPAPRTMLLGVRKVPPGHAVVLRRGTVQRTWRYYRLPYSQAPLRVTDAELAEQLHGHLVTAVERQLVADVPVGAFLSGGLDSSAVVALARRAAPQAPLPCFTVTFREGAVDDAPEDLPYARRVAQHLGVPLHELPVGVDLIDGLDHLLWLLDEPQADPAPLNALVIAQAARAAGIPVLLSGAGGDDILGGYRRHWALMAERRWRWLPHAARAGIGRTARAFASGRGVIGTRTGVARRVAKALAYADADGDARLASYFQWSTDEVRHALYGPAMKDATSGVPATAALLASLGTIPDERDPLNRMLFLEAAHFLPDHNLNYTDKTGMAAGVEVRVPLLDLDLVAFAARVPSDWKQRGTVGKPLFKRVMEPYLPRDVIYRPKAGFGAPVRQWLATSLRPLVDDVLGEASVARRGLFEPAAVRRLIALDREGRLDGAYTVFALLCLELWCRRFVDASPARR
jgi:asparagine synthase (glutamine-hydrolysing)